MAQDLILALDQGTTSTRAIAFTAPGLAVRAIARRDLPQHFPASGWVEHDPVEIYAHSTAVLREALAAAGGDVSRVAAIGITNQRETTVIWRRDTGRPIHNAIVWQDRRTAAHCARSLFLCDQDRLAARQRARRPGGSGSGGPCLRHG